MKKRKKKLPPGVYWDASAGTFKIDIRKRPEPRLHVSLDVRDEKDTELASQRAAAIRTLYDRADYAPIRRLRSGDLTIAEIAAAVREGDFDKLRRLSDQNITIDAAVEKHLEALREDRSEGTMESYDSLARRLLLKFSGRVLSEISSDECREWLNEPKVSRPGRKPRKWRTGTRAIAYTFARAVWSRAIKAELEHSKRTDTRARLTVNPWDAVERPHPENTRVVFLSSEEWRRLYERTEGHAVCALLALCCLAGLRREEAGHLRVSIDLDMEKRLIRIQPRTGRYAWKPKRRRSVRVVPMGEELHRILTAHFDAGFAESTYLIHPRNADRPYHSMSLTRLAREAFEDAGISWGSAGDGKVLHTLRHTFATRLLLGAPPEKPGVAVHVVAKLLGDRAEQVLGTYAHLLHDDLESAVLVMDDFARAV